MPIGALSLLLRGTPAPRPGRSDAPRHRHATRPMSPGPYAPRPIGAREPTGRGSAVLTTLRPSGPRRPRPDRPRTWCTTGPTAHGALAPWYLSTLAPARGRSSGGTTRGTAAPRRSSPDGPCPILIRDREVGREINWRRQSQGRVREDDHGIVAGGRCRDAGT